MRDSDQTPAAGGERAAAVPEQLDLRKSRALQAVGELGAGHLLQGELESPQMSVAHDEALGARHPLCAVVADSVCHHRAVLVDDVRRRAARLREQALQTPGVVQLDQQAATWSQRSREAREHVVVGLRVEVAKRREPVDDRVELLVVGERAHVGDLERGCGVLLAGELDPRLGVVDADHFAAHARQPARDAALPAGHVEHPQPRLELEQPPDELGVGIAARGDLVRVEVQVVVVEQFGRNGHRAML